MDDDLFDDVNPGQYQYNTHNNNTSGSSQPQQYYGYGGQQGGGGGSGSGGGGGQPPHQSWNPGYGAWNGGGGQWERNQPVAQGSGNNGQNQGARTNAEKAKLIKYFGIGRQIWKLFKNFVEHINRKEKDNLNREVPQELIDGAQTLEQKLELRTRFENVLGKKKFMELYSFFYKQYFEALRVCCKSLGEKFPEDKKQAFLARVEKLTSPYDLNMFIHKALQANKQVLTDFTNQTYKQLTLILRNKIKEHMMRKAAKDGMNPAGSGATAVQKPGVGGSQHPASATPVSSVQPVVRAGPGAPKTNTEAGRGRGKQAPLPPPTQRIPPGQMPARPLVGGPSSYPPGSVPMGMQPGMPTMQHGMMAPAPGSVPMHPRGMPMVRPPQGVPPKAPPKKTASSKSTGSTTKATKASKTKPKKPPNKTASTASTASATATTTKKAPSAKQGTKPTASKSVKPKGDLPKPPSSPAAPPPRKKILAASQSKAATLRFAEVPSLTYMHCPLVRERVERGLMEGIKAAAVSRQDGGGGGPSSFSPALIPDKSCQEYMSRMINGLLTSAISQVVEITKHRMEGEMKYSSAPDDGMGDTIEDELKVLEKENDIKMRMREEEFDLETLFAHMNEKNEKPSGKSSKRSSAASLASKRPAFTQLLKREKNQEGYIEKQIQDGKRAMWKEYILEEKKREDAKRVKLSHPATSGDQSSPPKLSGVSPRLTVETTDLEAFWSTYSAGAGGAWATLLHPGPM